MEKHTCKWNLNKNKLSISVLSFSETITARSSLFEQQRQEIKKNLKHNSFRKQIILLQLIYLSRESTISQSIGFDSSRKKRKIEQQEL
jgi:hypothetical protein